MATFKIMNIQKVNASLKRLRSTGLKTAERRGMNKVVKSAVAHIKKNFNKKVKRSSSGKIIPGGSAPFETPSVVEANLKGNITGEVALRGGLVFGLIGSYKDKGLSYDAFLEFGTGSRGAGDKGTINLDLYAKEFVQGLSFTTGIMGMHRRPYLEPALSGTNLTRLQRLFERSIKNDKSINRKV